MARGAGDDIRAGTRERCRDSRVCTVVRRRWSFVAEHQEHRQNSPVLPDRRFKSKLAEDLANMTLDGLEFQDEVLGDPLVRPTLCHEAEDLPLPRGQLVER